VNAYLDSSVILRLLLSEPNPVAGWGDWESAVSSELAKVEVWRTLHQRRFLNRITADELRQLGHRAGWLLAQIDFVRFDSRVLRRATEPFETVIATLDAIHLSSALVWRAERSAALTIFTHDRQFAKAARTYGFAVAPISQP